MPWEELPLGTRGSSFRTEWAVAIVAKNKTVHIKIPRGHRFEKAKQIKTLMGKEADLGWVKLISGEGEGFGRKIHLDKSGAASIMYSTLPGAPKEKRPAVIVQVRENEDGSIDVRLPWAPPLRIEREQVNFSREPTAPLKAGPLSTYPKKPEPEHVRTPMPTVPRPGVRTVPIEGDRSTDKPGSFNPLFKS